jgi:hypothetical protein
MLTYRCKPHTTRSWRGETEAIVAEETAELMPEANARLGTAERRLLAGMPLHAITSVYGEAGLQEQLAIEPAQFPAADRGRAQGRAGAGVPVARRGPAAARTLR